MQTNGRRFFAVRQLVVYTAGAVLVWMLLAHAAAQEDWRQDTFPDIALADTDSVTLYQIDSLRSMLFRLGRDSVKAMALNLGLDSLFLARIDSLSPPDTNERAKRYLSSLTRSGRSATIFRWPRRSLGPGLFPGWQHEIALDSVTGSFYTIKEQVAGKDVRHAIRLTREQYQAEKLSAALDRNWRNLIESQRTLEQRQRRGLGLSISVPGGRQSGFTTIFGKNEVDLRVNGSADIRPAFVYDKNAQQVLAGRGSQLSPEFNPNVVVVPRD